MIAASNLGKNFGWVRLMPKITEEKWLAAKRRQEQWEAERREKLYKVLGEAPMPLSDRDIQTLVRIPDQDFRYIIRAHPAYKLAHRRSSYRTSLSVFELCLQDLVAVIDQFADEAMSEERDIFDVRGKERLKAIERRVQKEMFATTDAAASLVDHCRMVTRKVKIEGLREKLAECFGDDGLHGFVIQLRILLHHIQFVEASWTIHYIFSEGAKTATFEISKDALLQAIVWGFKGSERRELEAFVARHKGKIDLKILLLEYGARVRRFYEWFDAQITSVALTDYDRIMLEKRKEGARNSWKLILIFALKMKVAVNPHDHLPKQLSVEDIVEINKLPRNSREQVDYIISLIDQDNAINDQLRDMAYQLFERAEEALTAPSPTPSCPPPDSGEA